MGKPTNKERLEHKELSKYFKRDSEIYTTFEKITEGLNKEKIIKLFIEECEYRMVCIDTDELEGVRCGNENFPKEDGIYFEELYKISKFKHDYYCSLLCVSQNNTDKIDFEWHYRGSDIRGNAIHIGQPNSYSISFWIHDGRLIEIFGKDRVQELGGTEGYPLGLRSLNFKLTAKEKELLRECIDKSPIGIRTIINKVHGNYGASTNSYNNSFLVEIDFTQPLEEIEIYIKHLHSKYHKNELPNVYDFLNIERKATNQKEIYKTNGHKDFNILLADKLFIYDSVKMGLPQTYAQKEIIKYHTKTKKISKDETTETTVRDYLHFMIGLIENDGLRKYSNSFTS